MTYKTGQWGAQEKARSKKRQAEGYWKQLYQRKKLKQPIHRATVGKVGEALSRAILTSGKFVDTTGYDTLWAGMRIEVKTSSFLPDYGGYKFSISPAQLKGCDFALLIALTPDGNEIFCYWFVPVSELKRSMKIREGNLARFAPYLVETKR